jgi:hypothetical protein
MVELGHQQKPMSERDLGAYLTNSTVTNYNTLYCLHIAQKFSKDTIGTILWIGKIEQSEPNEDVTKGGKFERKVPCRRVGVAVG